MKFVQARNYYQGGNRPRLIVIHDAEYPEKPTGAEWCADFFAGRNGLTAPKASAHYCVDNDSIVQCVKDEDGAWHVPGALNGLELNKSSIGIEHAGYARQTAAEWRDEYSTSMLELSAGLVADLCEQYGIPAKRLTVEELKAGESGICGHEDLTKATGKGSHWDPGPHFPWAWYMERVLYHRSLSEHAGEVAPPEDTWVRIEHDGALYDVAPIYVPFVGIGQAEKLAASLDCELPTPGLVDAIWRAADMKIDATKMVVVDHDGTPQTMASMATFARVTAKLDDIVDATGKSLGDGYRLLAGAFKDVVQKDGKVGLYGWHRPDGSVIQPFYDGHSRGWLDYSQALRLCRRVVA